MFKRRLHADEADVLMHHVSPAPDKDTPARKPRTRDAVKMAVAASEDTHTLYSICALLFHTLNINSRIFVLEQ